MITNKHIRNVLLSAYGDQLESFEETYWTFYEDEWNNYDPIWKKKYYLGLTDDYE